MGQALGEAIVIRRLWSYLRTLYRNSPHARDPDVYEMKCKLMSKTASQPTYAINPIEAMCDSGDAEAEAAEGMLEAPCTPSTQATSNMH